MITLLFTGLASMPCHAEFRDPTQPAYPLPAAANAAGSDNELVLSAIWISSHSRRATINGVSGKQGQTIVIEHASPLNPEPATPANTPATNARSKSGNSSGGGTPTAMDTGLLDKLTAIAPMQLAPLLAAATKSMDIPQLQDQIAMNPPTTRQQANTAQRPKMVHIPAPSSTIKIISIHKNSVVVDQNGELKTLQLVQRPYKTQ
ncbi:MAG: hypothetical protein PHD39_00055 [Methylobacter tundripaludum]|nr:hypothetical protein [Methylobacter tundripaludum]